MKILVTGISSALGTIIARKLSENHEVIGLSKRKVKGFKTISFDLLFKKIGQTFCLKVAN